MSEYVDSEKLYEDIGRCDRYEGVDGEIVLMAVGTIITQNSHKDVHRPLLFASSRQRQSSCHHPRSLA